MYFIFLLNTQMKIYKNYIYRGDVGMTITIYLSKTCKGKTIQWETQTIDLTNTTCIPIET